MYNTSKYYSYIYFYADRNVRPWTIQGYTLATFPKVAQYIFMHNSRRNRQENLAKLLEKGPCKGKHLVNAKCAHILLPLETLVTSTNKSVHHDIRIICEMDKNRKQYLNIVRVCLHFVQQKYMTIITTAIHTIIIITCTTYSIAVISLKSSIISSSFGKFKVNNDG